ncbi:MAG: FlaD/FlaE family flagellar protein [Candidatus Heimdallarchaeota archaeon]
MGDNMGGSGNNGLEDFELGNELSTLVAKNEIPSKIADKLEQKLKEKEVKITKEQLHMLVGKIKDIMRTYAKFDRVGKKDQPAKTEQTLKATSDMDMQKLVETMDKLQKRINNLEHGVITNKDESPKIVTTDDIQVPEKITVPLQDLTMKPLAGIPSDPESVIVLMKWLQHLIDKCGRSYLPTILDYYVDIGWISDEAKISLIDYSHGITDESNRGETTRKSVSDLPARDHIQSLLFIQKLKGREFDKHFLDRIDGEINRITKKLDIYRIK